MANGIPDIDYPMLRGMGYNPDEGIEGDGRFVERPTPAGGQRMALPANRAMLTPAEETDSYMFIAKHPPKQVTGAKVPSTRSPMETAIPSEPAKIPIDISKITSMQDYVVQGRKKFKLDQSPYQRASKMLMDSMPDLARSFSGGSYSGVTDMPDAMKQQFLQRLQKIIPVMLKMSTEQYDRDEAEFLTYGKIAQSTLESAQRLKAEQQKMAQQQLPTSDKVKGAYTELSKLQWAFVDDEYVPISPHPAQIENFRRAVANPIGLDLAVKDNRYYLIPMQQQAGGIPAPQKTQQPPQAQQIPPHIAKRLQAGGAPIVEGGIAYRINPETGNYQTRTYK